MEHKQILKLAQTIFAQMVAKDHELEMGAHETDPEHLKNVAAVAFLGAQAFAEMAERFEDGARTFDALTKPKEYVRWEHGPGQLPAPNCRCIIRKPILKDWEEYLAASPDEQREMRVKARGEKWKVVSRAGDILNLGIMDLKGERFRVWTRAAILDTFMPFMDGETGVISADVTLTEVARINSLDVLAVCMALHYIRDGA